MFINPGRPRRSRKLQPWGKLTVFKQAVHAPRRQQKKQRPEDIKISVRRLLQARHSERLDPVDNVLWSTTWRQAYIHTFMKLLNISKISLPQLAKSYIQYNLLACHIIIWFLPACLLHILFFLDFKSFVIISKWLVVAVVGTWATTWVGSREKGWGSFHVCFSAVQCWRVTEAEQGFAWSASVLYICRSCVETSQHLTYPCLTRPQLCIRLSGYTVHATVLADVTPHSLLDVLHLELVVIASL